MLTHLDYRSARAMVLAEVIPVAVQQLPLSACGGRILARDLTAEEDVPPFDRSAYDGYAFRSMDTAAAHAGAPVTLRVLEEVAAGATASGPVTAGTAVKILTGAPIPPGADAVVKYEHAVFTDASVTLFSSFQPWENIVRAGEDVSRGDLLAPRGTVIDPGVAGMLAAQGAAEPEVYRLPKIGILSTGSELVDADVRPGPGMIRNTSRYMLEALLAQSGFTSVYLGTAGDCAQGICDLLRKGLAECDAVICTGGVSVGDYDLTPEAMALAGARILFRGVDMKPGMACAYGSREGKLICGLSGNPAAALTNFLVIGLPALRKLAGRRNVLPQEIHLRLSQGFEKGSGSTRFLRGKLSIQEGLAWISFQENQGNAVISSAAGCDVLAVIPAGSGPVPAGTLLTGLLI